MIRAAISGDIIAFTSLSETERSNLETEIGSLFGALKATFDVFARMIKGDYLECYVPDPAIALRVVLAIKCYVKSVGKHIEERNPRIDKYKTYGVRLALGMGNISRFDPDKGIIDGEAIYYSGRMIGDTLDTSDKKRIVIKNTLFFKSPHEGLNQTMEPIMALLDFMLSNATARQNRVMYLKLMGYEEDRIAREMGISQSTVNRHSTGIGWNGIEKAVTFFEHYIKTQLQQQ